MSIITLGYLKTAAIIRSRRKRPSPLELPATFRRVQVLIGLSISAIALYLALHDVHWAKVWDAIGNANLALILLAAAILIATFGVRAFRWGVLLHDVPNLRFFYLFGSLNAGYFINNVLPFQMGELARAYLISELGAFSTTRSLSTVVVERVVDVLTLLLFLMFLAPFVPVPASARIPAFGFAIGAIAVAGFLTLASQRRGPVPPLLDWAIQRTPERSRPKIRQMADSGIQAFAVLANPRMGLAVVALSVMSWLCVGLVYFIGFKAFDMGLGYEAALIVVIATSLGFFFPSSPGAFGVYHALAIYALTTIFDVDKNLAVSYALVMHLLFYLPPIFIGTAFLWLERRVWRRTSMFGKLAELRGSQPTDWVQAPNG